MGQWPVKRGSSLGQAGRCRMCGERLHLTHGDLIEPLEPFALGKGHVDELGIHTFDADFKLWRIRHTQTRVEDRLPDAGELGGVSGELCTRVSWPSPRGYRGRH